MEVGVLKCKREEGTSQHRVNEVRKGLMRFENGMRKLKEQKIEVWRPVRDRVENDGPMKAARLRI